MRSFFLRLLLILSWVGFLSLALYLPKMTFFTPDSNTLNVFTWGDILDPRVIDAFEKETGIKVNLSYYSSNEELLVKLKATKGEGYDLVIPSDYAVDQLIKADLLRPIDHSKLNFWSKIHSNLLGHPFDPCNQYSIPFAWEIFLLGIQKGHFTSPNNLGWGLIFDKSAASYRVAMTGDPLEATLFASFYLFGPKNYLEANEIDQVKNLLIEQKKWVEAYASFRGDYFLATGSCQVALASSSYLWRTLKQFPSLGFVIPKEGTFLSIESFVLPKPTQKERLVYAFVNHLFTESSIYSHFDTFGFFPSALSCLPQENLTPELKELLSQAEKNFSSFHFIQEVMPQQTINDIWVEVKSGKY